MNNFLERINEVSTNLQSLDDVKTRGRELERLTTRCQQLEDAWRRLQKARSDEEILVKIVGALPRAPRASKELMAKPDELREQLEKDWVAFTNHKEVYSKLTQRLEKFTERLAEYLKSAWQKHLASVMPDLDEHSVDTLRNAGFKEESERLAELLYKLAQAKRQLPDSADAGDLIIEWTLEAKGIIKSLEGLPEPVKRFLTKASKSGAAIEELTSEIREWMASKGMLNLFIIKTRG